MSSTPFPLADSLMETGDLKSAIIEYKKEYLQNPDKHLAAYFLSASYSMDRQIDSAFKYLFISLLTDTTVHACSDPYFIPLWNDQRWNEFEKKAFDEALLGYPGGISNVPLSKKLLRMMALDQEYYYEINIVDKKLGLYSPVESALWDQKNIINKNNEEELDSIYNVNGWPAFSEVGHFASQGAFLIVQHADLARQKKYLPVIKKLCEQKQANWQDYALMYDRIEVRENRPQLYGSQLKYNDLTKKYELYPITDEKNVDKRRAEFNLEPLSDYLSFWGIIYEPKK